MQANLEEPEDNNGLIIFRFREVTAPDGDVHDGIQIEKWNVDPRDFAADLYKCKLLDDNTVEIIEPSTPSGFRSDQQKQEEELRQGGVYIEQIQVSHRTVRNGIVEETPRQQSSKIVKVDPKLGKLNTRHYGSQESPDATELECEFIDWPKTVQVREDPMNMHSTVVTLKTRSSVVFWRICLDVEKKRSAKSLGRKKGFGKLRSAAGRSGVSSASSSASSVSTEGSNKVPSVLGVPKPKPEENHDDEEEEE